MQPDFQMMPVELRELSRWVVWKGAKVPYCASAINRLASVTDPRTWSSFEHAEMAYVEGGYSGVGFVLNGDGIVGVDLDKCAPDGVPSTDALNLLSHLGCQYIELSPSGTGLRGFGYGDDIKGRRGVLDGLNVELYSSARYLTVTGRVLKNGPLVRLPGFQDVALSLKRMSPTEEGQKKTEENVCHLLSSSVGIPASTLPTREGERNRCLFQLARHIKGEQPNATREELRAIVSEWHKLVLPVIGTKDFAVTLADFMRCFESVKQPRGATLKIILDGIDFSAPLPSWIEALGYGEPSTRLVHVCIALQRHEGAKPFFISVRQAGELIGMHYTDASKVLTTLVADGVLSLVSKGAGKVASRYHCTERVIGV